MNVVVVVVLSPAFLHVSVVVPMGGQLSSAVQMVLLFLKVCTFLSTILGSKKARDVSA